MQEKISERTESTTSCYYKALLPLRGMLPDSQKEEAMKTNHHDDLAVNNKSEIRPNAAALATAAAFSSSATIYPTSTKHAAQSHQLPSWKYQFSRWHELEGSADTSELRGSMLHSPRVREGPKNVTSLFATHSVMFSKQTARWMDHRNNMEDWENVKSVNLSYQDLGDSYQTSDLLRCLKRLVCCTHLQLTDNSLTDLSRLTLPSCTHLNLSRNSFTSFKKLPKAPKLEYLSLANNSIASLSALSSLSSKYPTLKSLTLKGNIIEFSKDYRHRVFKKIPHLHELDSYPQLHSDSTSRSNSNSSIHLSSDSDKCTVS